MNTDKITIGNFPYSRPNDGYLNLENAIKNQFEWAVSPGTPLFTTTATNLFQTFLDNLPEESRQHYTCTACRRFVNNYGGLVTTSQIGEITAVMWDEEETPEFFKAAVAAVKCIVLKSQITGVFLTERSTLGQPKTGEWAHMSAELHLSNVFVRRKDTPGQVMAEKIKDHEMLSNALVQYSIGIAETAATIMQSANFSGDEKVVGRAIWFNDLHHSLVTVRNTRHRDNIIWLAVATAPVGFCHVKTSMFGTLLDDVVAGHSIETIKRKFEDKMHPLKYRRPQAPPSSGNIARGEQIIADLGLENSLVRRYARLDEIVTVWKPKETVEKQTTGGGVFSHLIPKEEEKQQNIMDVVGGLITWRKLVETVLTRAEKIEYRVKHGLSTYTAIVTAAHEDAPPILQWDREERRNPFSLYMYHKGSDHSQWGLTTGYKKVTGITLNPPMWFEEMPHQGKIVIFILEGAKDSNYKNVGNALFPQILISELNEIRATMELFSKKATIQGYDDSSACGIAFGEGSNVILELRVTTGNIRTTYYMDRWE